MSTSSERFVESSFGAPGEGGEDPPLHGNSEGTGEGDPNEEHICLACERKKTGGKPYKHGHANYCEKSIYYGLSDDQIAAVKDERSSKLKDTKENVLRRMGLSVKDSELKFPEISESFPKVCDVPADLTAKHLSALVSANISNTAKAPLAVTVILRYLHMLAPNMKKGTNSVIDHEENLNKLEFFRTIFPRGSITFTVPKEDPVVKPNPDYRIAEGCKLLLVRWELQTDEDLKCPFCKQGSLTYKKLAFSRTAVRPIIDIEGKLTWAVGSTYRCMKCDLTVQATDPELLQSLPSWMQDAYPVDHPWINKIKTFQIGRRLAGLIETIFIGEGYDGHFVSYFLRKLYDNRYRADHKLLIDAFQMQGEDGPTKEEWSFDKWTGEFTFPLGDFLREAFDFSRKGDFNRDDPHGLQDTPNLSPRHPSSAKRPPLTGPTGAPIISPRKRQTRPEDFADRHSKPSGSSGLHGHHGAPPHQLGPPPPPLPIFVPHGRQGGGGAPAAGPGGGLSPAGASMSPHTPPSYAVHPHHQWPGAYGPAPPFPMHYSPPPRYPAGPFAFGGGGGGGRSMGMPIQQQLQQQAPIQPQPVAGTPTSTQPNTIAVAPASDTGGASKGALASPGDGTSKNPRGRGFGTIN
jgi:hypothetical protein